MFAIEAKPGEANCARGARHELERVNDELLRECKGWIGHDAGSAGRRALLIEKIDTGAAVWAAPVVQVGGVHNVTGAAQHLDDPVVQVAW